MVETKPSRSDPAVLACSFYVGGFEEVGGIESFFFDLLTGLRGWSGDRSLFVWGRPLQELSTIERAGTRVYRSPLRRGARFGLPDRLLCARFMDQLVRADKIIFGKFPPRHVYERLLRRQSLSGSRRSELIYITAYRPAELWPAGLPDWIGSTIDTMVVQSPEFAEDLRRDGFRRRIVELPLVPPPAANRVAPLKLDRRQCRLGFLGRFVPQKNLFYLLEIVRLLFDEAVELHMMGSGIEEAQLKACAAREGLPVKFWGALRRSEVPEAIELCDIFLNASHSEGQCLIALEVLSRGRPFVATPVGAIPHILDRGRFGTSIPLNDAPAAASILRAMIAEWRAGRWEPTDIVRDYREAYSRSAVLEAYKRLFSDTSQATDKDSCDPAGNSVFKADRN